MMYLGFRFYETFGDETTNELVDWFNGVDSQYKSELRELADGYYGRFRAELKAEVAGLRAELIKWMFVFWVGQTVALGGLGIALVQAVRP